MSTDQAGRAGRKTSGALGLHDPSGRQAIARGERVHLRDADTGDAELLSRWASPDFLGEFNDLGPPDEEVAGGRRPVFHAIVVRSADDVPIGHVSWHAVMYGPNRASRAWNIGINLVPAERYRGYGAEVQRLLAEHLLSSTDANRVEASTDVENVAEQRALQKAGFVREGTLRGAQHRAGHWHDMVIYSLLRSDL